MLAKEVVIKPEPTRGGLGIWAFVDWIIGLVKVYGNSFGQDEDVKFINGKYAR